ncbi:lipopolysaccharide biosynthesis protein [uncultured Roseobacter sp.]|uniref:lipopolysaccharide biosynthesis protein n=1 Tax=uncultured Roseobacter sp. TaxID=114847 RepID=UPI002617081B|nr:lipopolysaccharide biosynthesis protein [uncultured Roseobacter sp.]
MKRLMLGSVLSAALKIASAGLTFLMFMFLARVLGPVEYGLFASMFALATVGSVASLFGQHTLIIKTLSSLGEAQEAAADRRKAMRQSYLVTLAGGVCFIAVIMIAGLAARQAGVDVDMRYLIGAAALVLPFTLSELVSHQYRAFGSILWALAPRDVIWRGAVVLACLGAAGLPFIFTNALTAMIALSVGLAAIVAVQLLAMIRQHSARFAARPGAQSTHRMDWRMSGWMWLASLGTMGGSLNLSGAALFLPPDQVGAYFAAQKTSQLLQLPIIAIDIAATPVFARMHAQNDFDGLRNVGRKLAMLIAVPLAIGAAVIFSFAPQLLSLFDPAFAAAAGALTLLAGSYLLIGLGGPTRQLMLMSNGERQVVRLTLIAEGIGLALIPVLVPAFGIMGAALAACVARVLFTVMTVLWCRARLGVDTSVLSLLPGVSVPR